MSIRQYSIFLLLFLCGCEKYYLSVKKESIDRFSLASTFVKSPDPLQNHPPTGEELIIEWRLSPEDFDNDLVLVLSVVYNNHTKDLFSHPISKRRGMVTYSILNNDYTKTNGFLTYKAEVKSKSGRILKKWEQQLWVDLISIDGVNLQN